MSEKVPHRFFIGLLFGLAFIVTLMGSLLYSIQTAAIVAVALALIVAIRGLPVPAGSRLKAWLLVTVVPMALGCVGAYIVQLSR